MIDDASLRGDCSRCVGLCCVALAFDRGPRFGFDKPAGEPCRHLSPRHACAIHDELPDVGFAGCATYDCRGAGQLATALFAGLDWRTSAAVARQMFRAFAILREIQQLRILVGRDPALAGQLEPHAGWTLETLLTLDLPAIRADARLRLLSKARASTRPPPARAL